MTTTPLQDLIIQDLASNPNSTAAEIGNRNHISTRSVSTTLTWLRGAAIVEDGSSSTEVYDATGTLVGIGYTPAAKPIKWALK